MENFWTASFAEWLLIRKAKIEDLIKINIELDGHDRNVNIPEDIIPYCRLRLSMISSLLKKWEASNCFGIDFPNTLNTSPTMMKMLSTKTYVFDINRYFGLKARQAKRQAQSEDNGTDNGNNSDDDAGNVTMSQPVAKISKKNGKASVGDRGRHTKVPAVNGSEVSLSSSVSSANNVNNRMIVDDDEDETDE